MPEAAYPRSEGGRQVAVGSGAWVVHAQGAGRRSAAEKAGRPMVGAALHEEKAAQAGSACPMAVELQVPREGAVSRGKHVEEK